MVFNDVVKNVVEGTRGALASLIMGTDGITLSSFTKEGTVMDMEVIGIEYANMLTDVKKASESLDTGDVNEICVTTEKFVILLRTVTKEYFFAMAIAPSGNIGKGRFLLRVNAPRISREL